MPLSDYEREVLAQMERALRSDDPELATSLRGNEVPTGVGRWMLGGAAIVVGLVLLVVSVAIAIPWLGLIAFLVMFGGAWWAITKPKPKNNVGVVGPDGKVRPPAKKKPKKPNSGTFMDRMEERWDRRDEI